MTEKMTELYGSVLMKDWQHGHINTFLLVFPPQSEHVNSPFSPGPIQEPRAPFLLFSISLLIKCFIYPVLFPTFSSFSIISMSVLILSLSLTLVVLPASYLAEALFCASLAIYSSPILSNALLTILTIVSSSKYEISFELLTNALIIVSAP